MPDRRLLVAALLAALALLAGACSEPEVDLSPPERQDGWHLYDEVGVVGGSVEGRLSALRVETDVDVVALVFEDERASLGQADRAGRVMLQAWDADVVLVAVARPGDFDNPDPDARQRFFGITATDRFAVTQDLRERIVEEAVPGPAAENDWTEAFLAAIDELEADLAVEEG